MHVLCRDDTAFASRPPGLVQTRVIHCSAGTGTLAVHLAAFERAQFDLSAFAHAGIVLPPTIGRSVRKRQAEYFFGRLAARDALAGAGIRDCQIASGAQREPLWPAGMVGSITHNHALAGACVARAGTWRGVGIDIEGVPDADAAASIGQRVLCAQERAYVRAAAGLPEGLLLALAFSAKESFYKALFPVVNRYFGFEALQLGPLDAAARRWHFVTREALCPAWPAGRTGHVDFTLLDADTVLTSFAW